MSDYYTNTTEISEEALGGIFAALAGVFLFIILIGLIFWIINVIFQWKVFEKAGKPGWAALIPIYNIVVMFDIAGLPLWNVLLLLVPILNIYIMVKANINLSKNFGKPGAFALGLIFLPIVFWGILAFDNSTYNQVITPENSDFA
jgi:hypothetical protein